jgi:tetratricopeptide (TPR) repeat protein
MKKLRSILAPVMIAGAFALSPVTSNAQDDEQTKFERNWHETCYGKKNMEQCYTLSKELLDKYPKSVYVKHATQIVTTHEVKLAYDKYTNAYKAFNAAPDNNKLEQLFTAGDEYLKIQPDQQIVLCYLATAGINGVSASYTNLEKVKGYAERALKFVESPTPPKDMKPEDWSALRDSIQATVYQFLGYYVIEKKGDEQEAINYLTKATQVKGKDGAGWKEPNNYNLRSSIYLNQYTQLSAEYSKMAETDKAGDLGKAMIARINDLVDTKLIPDLARVIATATKPEVKTMADEARSNFDKFWKFRTEAPEKSAEYIRAFQVDPTVPGPAIPVKTDISSNAGAPEVGPTNTKLTPGSSTSGAKNGSNSKPSTTKSRPSTRKRGRRG